LIPSPKVLWGEGLFLRPQHFQQQDAYHEWRLTQACRSLHPHAWGVRHIKLDLEALQAGILRVLELHAVLPDGEMFHAPAEDELPPPVVIGSLPSSNESSAFIFHLASAALRSQGTNMAATHQDADTAVRYHCSAHQVADHYTNAVTAELMSLRRSTRLLPDTSPRDHLISLPLLRLQRTSSGAFELDGRFMPPSLHIHASPMLTLHLRRLMDSLQAKIDALHGMHREPSKHVIEFRSGDMASFWMLHTANTALAGLTHLARNPGLHPERLFEKLLELAGSLMTFSRTFTLSELPTYDHTQPGPAFIKLDRIIRDLLDTVISTRSFAIAMSEIIPSFHRGRLDSEQITPSTQLYLSVSAAMPSSELIEVVPQRFKIGAPDDVEKMVLSAMPGVRLTYMPQVPAAVPVRPGNHYFSLDARGTLYERMLQAQSLTLYTPSGIQDLNLELVAINA
jgi:type VI secretion system protein ImpJ